MSTLMSSKRTGVLSSSPLCCLHYQLHLGAQQQLYGSSGPRILTRQYPREDKRLILSLSLIQSLSLRSLRTFHGRAQHTSIPSQKPELGRMPIPGLVPGKGNEPVPGLEVASTSLGECGSMEEELPEHTQVPSIRKERRCYRGIVQYPLDLPFPLISVCSSHKGHFSPELELV